MKKLAFLLASLCLVALPYSALAQSTPAECSSDTSRYCGQVSGTQNVQNCLIDHQKEVSDACYNGLKAQLGTATSKASDNGAATGPGEGTGSGGGAGAVSGGAHNAQACKADAESFCKGIQPGGGRIARCLVEHKSELSEPCKTTLTEAIKNRRNK
jgi:hypothetical protein